MAGDQQVSINQEGLIVTVPAEEAGTVTLVEGRFLRMVSDAFPFTRMFSVQNTLTEEIRAKFPGKPIISSSWEFGMRQLWSSDYGIMFVETSTLGGRNQLELAAENQRKLDEYVEVITPLLPPAPEPKQESPTVLVNFWTGGGAGMTIPRHIEVPKWGEINKNYPTATRNSLTSMIEDFEAEAGKLILWHGEPGTGKTWALRAVLSEWRSWCNPVYIVDPERLFGTDSNYLMRVLFANPAAQESAIDYAAMRPTRRKASKKNQKWQLIILEDTGELLAQDAKARAGQGLSRLLNVTDGLIGQGLRLIVLITTNETISKLHPAVARPGRTAAEIEFISFNREESAIWLKDHSFNGDGQISSHTLAELYAMTGGRKVKTEVALGFGRG